jgi:hypothetical protein
MRRRNPRIDLAKRPGESEWVFDCSIVLDSLCRKYELLYGNEARHVVAERLARPASHYVGDASEPSSKYRSKAPRKKEEMCHDARLHPSWEAKRRQASRLATSFKGEHQVFDD